MTHCQIADAKMVDHVWLIRRSACLSISCGIIPARMKIHRSTTDMHDNRSDAFCGVLVHDALTKAQLNLLSLLIMS